MSWLRFVRRRKRDDEMAREIESYIEHEVDELIARGVPVADARRRARRKFGNQTMVREAAYERNSLRVLESFAQDLLHGFRQLRRNPGFAVTATLILGLGIAASTVIFSIAYSVMLRDLPYDEPDRLVSVGTSLRGLGRHRTPAGAADYFDWRARQQVFEEIGLTRAVANYNLTGAGEPERLQGARTTASLFAALRAAPLMGRTYTEREQLDPGLASSVAVLSHALWQRRFGSDPTIVGRKILLNGKPHEVLGVMRPEFQYPSREFELWTPLYFPPQALEGRSDYSYLSVARLKQGVTLAQAQAHMMVIAGNLARQYPRTNQDSNVVVEPMLSQLTGAVRGALWVLLGAVGVLFLAGCLNLANLLLARAATRGREFSIRTSLGATKWRMARQFFAEAIPLALAGALLGILAAHWLLQMLIPLLPASLPRIGEIGLHGPVLAAAVLLSVAAAILSALAPATQVTASIERGPASGGGVRDLLMVTEIACTVVLLVTAGLLMKSFAQLRATDPGFKADGVLSLHLAVSRAKHGDDPGVARYLGTLIDGVRDIPGVKSVGIVNRLPLGGQTQMGNVRFEGRDESVSADWRSASGGYFEAMGLRLTAGRTFLETDTAGRPAVGIIDERLAREVFGAASPLGKRFRMDVPGVPWIEVVGVAGHLRHEGLDIDSRGQIYWPYQQRTQDRMAMVVRTVGDPAAFTDAVRKAIRAVDADQPLYDVRPMREVVERTLIDRWLNTLLLGTFAGLALVLASVGLYGVVSYLTAQRKREFGIRLAVGASGGSVVGLVLRQGLVRAVAGLTLGLTLSAAAARALGAMLHGTSPVDAVIYGSVAAVLLAVVLAASFVPAWRASRIDPVDALRSE